MNFTTIGHKEMFPQLDNNDKNRFINFLQEKDLKTFMEQALELAQYELTDDDLQLCEIVCDTMIRKGIISYENHQATVDGIFMAAMLRNCFKDEENPITSIYMPRQKFRKIELESYKSISKNVKEKAECKFDYPIRPQFCEQLYQLIEGQHGDLTEVQYCKPSVGSIQEMFAQCIYIQECIKKYS